MAGLRRRDVHRRGRPRRLGRRVRLRRRRRRRHRRRRASPGAATIIAVDLDARKLELGQGVRRHPHRRRRRTVDPVEAIRALTDGNGADVCIEAVGNPEVLEQAFFARDLAGTVVQVGRARPDDDASSSR